MTMTDAQAARQWADSWTGEPTNSLLAAVYRHILATTQPPTMAEVGWDDEAHAGLCAEHPKHGLVVMFRQDVDGYVHYLYQGDRGVMTFWDSPRSLTPIPGMKIDLTPRREPVSNESAETGNENRNEGVMTGNDHPVTLSSVEDYDNAPTGTVIAYADDVAVKRDDGRWYWSGQSGTSWAEDLADADACTVVRWGK